MALFGKIIPSAKGNCYRGRSSQGVARTTLHITLEETAVRIAPIGVTFGGIVAVAGAVALAGHFAFARPAEAQIAGPEMFMSHKPTTVTLVMARDMSTSTTPATNDFRSV